MRIAFISFEYPPDIPKGGIATYVEQASTLLCVRGNNVEIFCASYSRNTSQNENGILIHRCLVKELKDFRESCLRRFTERHLISPFDIVECPEIHADALLIKEKFPLLPLVVKLHMASFIQNRLLNFYTASLIKLRYFLGGIKQGKIHFYGAYDYKDDVEYKFCKLADAVAAPSPEQKKIIVDEWHFPPGKITVIPNPYAPPASLINISVSKPVDKVITFVGKLNVHKGIVNLIKTIPGVVSRYPDVVFRLIGNDSYFSAKKKMMSDYIAFELKGYEKNFVTLGALKYEDVLKQYSESAICVFPSLWECFGLVCLEAMSAGRAVIGSNRGGMNGILDDGAGVLVNPHNIKAMEEAIINLLGNESLRWELGEKARLKVSSVFNTSLIGQQMEAHYHRTVEIAAKGLV